MSDEPVKQPCAVSQVPAVLLADRSPRSDRLAGLLPASIGEGASAWSHADVRSGRARFAVRDGLRVNVTPETTKRRSSVTYADARPRLT